MIYHGKTIRLANLTQGFITGETQSTLNIDCDILSGASSTMARGNTNHPTLKSWSVEGEVNFNVKQFIAFWHWLANNETCTLAFATPSVSIYGDVIITSLTISAPMRSIVKIQFKAIGTGKPDILYS